MVKIVTATENREALMQYVPEAMLLTYSVNIFLGDSESSEEETDFMRALKEAETWADCILIGPGIGTDRRASELLKFSISESDLPLVIDADGLNLLAENKVLKEAVADCARQGRTVILTPHLGEFARLYGCTTEQVKEHLTEYPIELCEKLNCIVVCKDARTVVVWNGGAHGYVNTTGNAGMATAGSGDVLAGMVTGLLAQKMPGSEAAIAAVYLHGIAGDLAAERKTQTSMTATDIIDCIGDVVRMQQKNTQQNEAEKKS